MMSFGPVFSYYLCCTRTGPFTEMRAAAMFMCELKAARDSLHA